MTAKTDDRAHARESALAKFEHIEELFAKVDDLDDDEDAQDAVYDELREMPLSVRVRGDWVEPGQESKPTEFELLMGTGGPAVRIRGDLNEYGEPTRAYLQGARLGHAVVRRPPGSRVWRRAAPLRQPVLLR